MKDTCDIAIEIEIGMPSLTLWSVVVFIPGSSTGLMFCNVADGRPSKVNVN